MSPSGLLPELESGHEVSMWDFEDSGLLMGCGSRILGWS